MYSEILKITDWTHLGLQQPRRKTSWQDACTHDQRFVSHWAVDAINFLISDFGEMLIIKKVHLKQMWQ